MKLTHLSLFTILAFSIFSHAGDERGNGGGGINRNGVYMTFGSAGVFVNPEPKDEVAGLDVVMDTINGLKLDDTRKTAFLKVVMPMGARKYYDVIREKFDTATYTKLKQEYANITKQPIESIIIFAITDPKTRATYLLPEFNNLRIEEQAAVLFHEAYWVFKPDATYSEVVAAEIAFQKFIEAKKKNSYDADLGAKLSLLFKDDSLAFNMDLDYDLKSGALSQFGADHSGLPLKNLFPQSMIFCSKSSDGFFGGKISTEQLSIYLFKLSRENPKSFFLRTLMNYIAPDNFGTQGYIIFKTINNVDGQCDFDATLNVFRINAVYARTAFNTPVNFGREVRLRSN